MREPITNVKFYKYIESESDGNDYEIISIFVDQETQDKRLKNGYIHYGQHTQVHVDWIKEECTLAKVHEYEDLYRELTNTVGYKLNVLNDDFEYLLEKDINEAIREKCYITQDDSDDIHDSVYNVSSVVMGFIKEKFL